MIRDSFAGQYPLDDTKQGIDAYNTACSRPEGFVLKPQREGGGNNFYGKDVKLQLEKLSAKERNAYILMDLIHPPKFKNAMVRNGLVSILEVVSELGIYGTWVSDGPIVHLNEFSGHLLRTKRFYVLK